MKTTGFRKSTNIEDRRGRWYDLEPDDDAVLTMNAPLKKKKTADGDEPSAPASDGADDEDRSPSLGHTNARTEDAVDGRRRAKRTLAEKDDIELTQRAGLEDLSDKTKSLEDPAAKARDDRRKRWYQENGADKLTNDDNED